MQKLANTFNASDFIQYKLNRACFSSTLTSVLTTASIMPSQATFPGKLHSVSFPDILMLLLQNYAKIIVYLFNLVAVQLLTSQLASSKVNTHQQVKSKNCC